MSRKLIIYFAVLILYSPSTPILRREIASKAIPIASQDAEPERCQKALLRTLRPVPESANRHFIMATQTPVQRLDRDSKVLRPLLFPMFRSQVLEKGSFTYSIIDNSDFNRLEKATRGKGLWLLYTPANGSNRNPIGHTSTSINGTYFTGQYAMGSLGDVGARLDSNPYVVAQFLEVSEASNRILDKFYHDRTYFYHQGNPDYSSSYVVFPHSRDAGIPDGENCTTFPFSALEPKWIAKRPELQQVANDIGQIEVSELPNRLVYTVVHSPAYRGAVIVTHDKAGAIQWITQGDFNASQSGHQLLFQGRPELLPQPIGKTNTKAQTGTPQSQ